VCSSDLDESPARVIVAVLPVPKTNWLVLLVKLALKAVMAPLAVTLKLADLIRLLYPVPMLKAVKVLLAIGVTFGRLIEFRVLALALELVVPVGVMLTPFMVVAVEDALALVKLKLARLALLVFRAISDRLKIDPEVAVPFKVAPAKVGVAVELMFWMVFTAPLLTEKLVELNEATPTVLVVAFATEISPVAEIETGAVPDTAIVPEASGTVIVCTADGLAGLRVMLLPLAVPRTKPVPI